MSRTLVTSDDHFGHERIIPLCNRPFVDVDEMDAALIDNWNRAVAPDDTVWVLGDFALGDRSRGLSYLPRLHGTKILVSGNHDTCWGGQKNGWRHQRTYLDAGFAAVLDYSTLSLPGPRRGAPHRRVVLSHFPYAGDSHDQDRYGQFRPRDTGGWVVHGHVHGSYTVRNRGVNVGVDVWDYTPVEDVTIARLIDAVEAGDIAEY